MTVVVPLSAFLTFISELFFSSVIAFLSFLLYLDFSLHNNWSLFIFFHPASEAITQEWKKILKKTKEVKGGKSGKKDNLVTRQDIRNLSPIQFLTPPIRA